MRLPTPREPLCSMTQTRSRLVEADLDEVVARPRACRAGHVCRVRSLRAACASAGVRPAERRRSACATGRRPRPARRGRARRAAAAVRAPPPRWRVRSRASVSGRSLARRAWCAPRIMPQPMSTPTAAGMIAPRVGMTLPTVAPMPKCTSGIAATHRCTIGSRATFSSWRRACGSRTPVQALTGTRPFVSWARIGTLSAGPARIRGRSGRRPASRDVRRIPPSR